MTKRFLVWTYTQKGELSPQISYGTYHKPKESLIQVLGTCEIKEEHFNLTLDELVKYDVYQFKGTIPE